MNAQLEQVIATVLLAGSSLLAQQTGTMIGHTPGSATGQQLPSVSAGRPAPSCQSAAAAAAQMFLNLPQMIYSRTLDYMVCLRHRDGTAEKLLNAGPWMALSPKGSELAYWLPERSEVHVFSIDSRRDTLVDTVPGGVMSRMTWSSQGRVLIYEFARVAPGGQRVIDLDSGKRQILEAGTRLDPTIGLHELLRTTMDGVERVNLMDGHNELIARVRYADSAEYSPSGKLLGILAANVEDSPMAGESDDGVSDCEGGIFTLYVQQTESKQLTRVPFPKGFNSVLDYDFAPDDRSIAVTFGAAACDYPGDVARTYVVSLPDLKMKPISPADRLSVKARWSPDGRVVVYSDYTGDAPPLVAVEVNTGRSARLTSQSSDGPDQILGWYEK